MFYDSTGKMRSAGVETTLPETVEKAGEEEWLKVEWYRNDPHFLAVVLLTSHHKRFKMRLRPAHLPPSVLNKVVLPSLPAGKTIKNIYADFMRYLFACAEKSICERHPTVARSWSDLKESGAITFVIAHPNGWEGAPQAVLRKSAVMGGLVPDTTEGRSRISFVTEREAALHYCIRGGFINDVRMFYGTLRLLLANYSSGG